MIWKGAGGDRARLMRVMMGDRGGGRGRSREVAGDRSEGAWVGVINEIGAKKGFEGVSWGGGYPCIRNLRRAFLEIRCG